ncbi:hypothetical protein D3OALGA1CA_2408 [Olavius algarvensis associated proteobacterium Delta 3]|nr:hypothetical protein D3OALGB2SA_309 [Olavius algarvensis associated proteobacterium Delta 3]CAB5117962.1 hypothetical protein D3OALGA1CA_2408 [Olavius algarvensis associated proteobacterium Delta 3]
MGLFKVTENVAQPIFAQDAKQQAPVKKPLTRKTAIFTHHQKSIKSCGKSKIIFTNVGLSFSTWQS